MAIDKETRKKCEQVIYDAFNALDPTGANTQYYQTLFAGMSDAEFTRLISKRLPFRYHVAPFKNEPTMNNCFDCFNKVLHKPLIETVKLSYLPKNTNGDPVESKECLVGYLNIKRLKQMMAKKTNAAMEITKRDRKTGRLLGEDKGGAESDKEFEGAMALGLENTAIEYARVKASAMKAKTEAYKAINVKGEVSFEDIDPDKTDSLAKNTLNVYLIGANLHSNLIDTDYYTPYTLNKKKASIDRLGGSTKV